MNRALLIVFVIGVIAVSNAQIFFEQGDYRDECKTTSNIDGICVNIAKCEPYVELLKNRARGPDVINFLNEVNCGFEGNDSKVCCVEDTESLIQDRFQ